MSDQNGNVSHGGIGFLGALTIVFVIFKLLGKITWAWKWVFAPIWIPLALLGSVIIIALIIWVLVQLYKYRLKKL